MKTDSLSRLSAAILDAKSPEAKADASTSFAMKLAQFGRVLEAREILMSLRRNHFESTSARVSIRVILLEGILGYYENRDPESFDRALRAYALAKAANIHDIEVESAIWLAHFAFNFEKYDTLQFAVHAAFEGFDVTENDLRSRLCLVVADAYQFLGERTASAEWYNLARIFARKAQDRALIVAVEYNRLAMGLSRVRVEYCIPSLGFAGIDRNWLMELSSVQGLHAGFSITALSELLTLSAALTYKAKGEFRRAGEEFIRIRDRAAAEQCGMSEILLNLEIQWCDVMVQIDDKECEVVIPSLGELDSISHNDQLIALRLIDDIASKLDISLDREKFDAMTHRCTTLCIAADEAMRRSISIAPTYLDSIGYRVGDVGS